MNLLVSANRTYLDKTETMIYSLSRFVSGSLSIWCLYSELSSQQRNRFSRHVRERSNVTHFEFIDMGWVCQEKDSFPLHTRHLSTESYFRLFAQFFLPDDLDRILWLDSDIIVKGPLDPLYHSPFNEAPLIAFFNMEAQRKNDWHLRRLGLSLSKPYFNAGVLLMNLNALRTITSKSEILAFCTNNAFRLEYEDQDVMNLLYHDSALVLNDQRFNCMVNAPKDFSTPDIAEKAFVIHYAGWEKPWLVQWHNEFSHYWWDVRREEGLRFGDRCMFALGWIWKKANGHYWKKLLLTPYLWYAERKARKAR